VTERSRFLVVVTAAAVTALLWILYSPRRRRGPRWPVTAILFALGWFVGLIVALYWVLE
jgi:hypothetical protein